MKYWFTSDTHFGHANIIGYTGRPFKDVIHMNEELIRRWNTRVKPDDTVFHLGDFAMMGGSYQKYLNRLNGNIVWIAGNHDKKPIIKDMIIEHGGHHWHLAHNPQDCHGEYNLCGHVHEKWKARRQENNHIYINVGVDQWDFYPIDIKQILKAMEDAKNGI